MKMLGIATALLALTAFAQAGEMEGKIKAVDAGKKMIELEGGTMMMTVEGVMLDNLMAGDEVMVMTDDKNMVTDVKKK